MTRNWRAAGRDWKAPEPKIKTGWLARYAKVVTSAHTGAICKA